MINKPKGTCFFLLKQCVIALLTFALGFPISAGALLSVDPVQEPDAPRNPIWLPLVSFVLPGLGQYVEDQQSAGVFYSGLTVGGLALAANARKNLGQEIKDVDLHKQSDLHRQYTYGAQLYLFAGEMSAFHTFRTRIETQKAQGAYTFVTKERPTDLMMAPFQVEHVVRPTTFVPLLLLAVVGATGAKAGGYLTLGDSAFTGGVSYNAGVGEEAFFRGYLMPVLREAWGSDFWSNATTSLVFGAAHISGYNTAPVAQTLMGFYLGWLTQRNGYSPRQAVFLHTWWDVLAIGFSLADQRANVVAQPIPLLNISF